MKIALNLFVDAVSTSFVYRLHQFIHLANLLVTHLIHKIHVQLLTSPLISLKLLAILLPLGEKADDVQRILDVFVSAKLGLEVRVAKNPLFACQLLAVGAKKSTIQLNGWENGYWRWPLAWPEGLLGWCREQA